MLGVDDQSGPRSVSNTAPPMVWQRQVHGTWDKTRGIATGSVRELRRHKLSIAIEVSPEVRGATLSTRG